MSSEVGITVAGIAAKLELTPANAAAVADRPVTGALVSDLLSYVMANGRAGQIWVTVQGHANIVAVAVLANLAAVIVADGFQPEEEAVARAEEEGLALFTSPLDPFTLAGRLYEMGLR